jgi:type III pantothenate kinase
VLLAADLRNAHSVLGLLGGAGADRDLVGHWRVSTDRRRTADEWAVLVHRLVADVSPQRPLTEVAVAATVPAVLHEWRDMLGRHFADLPKTVVEPGTRTGLPVLTDNPREVGADRICNAVAAAHLYAAPVVVVDIGDAITFDVVSPEGRYIGGAITPGIQMSLEALGQRSAQLREVELLRPRSVIGRSTVDALQSGLVYGVAAQIDGLVARITTELGVAATVVATGHVAPVVLRDCASIDEYVPLLTLRGLALVHHRNH